MTAHGWTAELWIPFSQLRFNDQPERDLGTQREAVAAPAERAGLLGRHRPDAARLGLAVRRPARHRRSVADEPARGAAVRREFVADDGIAIRNDPFDNGLNLTGRVGADVKVGIGPNLTLEATVNPDFGQIEADPAEVNLTVFETIFDERRPFFIEGNNRLEPSASNYYYSRRIGARPTGPATGEYVRLSRSKHDSRRGEADGPAPHGHFARLPRRGDRGRERRRLQQRRRVRTSRSRRGRRGAWPACCRSSIARGRPSALT